MATATMGRALRFDTRNPLPEATRIIVCGLLNSRLADAIDLWLHAKQAHWNVKGPHFIALHQLFDKVAEEVGANVDQIAERVTQLGGLAQGTLQSAAKATTLEPYALETIDSQLHVDSLAVALAGFAGHLHVDIAKCTKEGDAGSADLLTEIARDIEQYLWFVESHLAQAGVAKA